MVNICKWVLNVQVKVKKLYCINIFENKYFLISSVFILDGKNRPITTLSLQKYVHLYLVNNSS